MKSNRFFKVLRETAHAWSEDKVPRMGAALAYYTIFSMAPLLILMMSIASLLFGGEVAQGEIHNEITSTVGPAAAAAIEDLLKHASQSGDGLGAAIIGTVILLFGASGVFVELQDALNMIWKVAPKPGRAIRTIIRDRFLSFAAVLGMGFLLLVSLVISALLAAMAKFLTPAALPGGAMLWQALDGLVSFTFITLLFAMIFKILPDATIAWRDVWIGAGITALLFTAGKFLLALYLGQASTTSAFGAAGSLVVLLLWVYYSSQIMLLGAEFTRVFANEFGIKIVPTANAVALSADACGPQRMPHSANLLSSSAHFNVSP